MSQRARIPTRIELHRLKYLWSKNQANFSELITFAELDPASKKLVSDDVFSQIRRNGGEDRYRVYAEVLASWGIICPHPQHMRLYSGKVESPFPLASHRWYKCKCCECSCMNEDFSLPELERKSL